MSVTIDIDMPISCWKCKLFINCDSCESLKTRCAMLGQIGYEEDVPKDHRRPDCPLKEGSDVKPRHTVVTAGNCTVCGTPLKDGSLFLCKECQGKVGRT